MLHARLVIAGLVLGASPLAHAGDRAELLRAAGEDLGQYYRNVLALTRTPTSADTLKSPDDCVAAIAAWKAKGVKDADRIFSYDFNQHPSAKNNTIALSDMPAVCTQYRPLYARYKVVFDLDRFAGTLLKIRDSFVKPGDSVLTETVIAEYEKLGDGAACKASVKAATDIDPKLVIRGAGSVGTVALADFDAKVCDALGKVVPPFIAAARTALAERQKEVLAKYSAAGIAGDKLALIAKYEGVAWRLVGGKRTDDPKELAKAAVLFQWLEGDDPADSRYTIHTIRKYRFKGNTLANTSEQQVRRLDGKDVGDVFR